MWVKRVGRIRLPPLGTKAAWRGNRCRQGTACTLRLAGRWWSRAHPGAKCGWWEQRREEVKPCQDTNTQVDTELYGWGGVERLEEIIQRQSYKRALKSLRYSRTLGKLENWTYQTFWAAFCLRCFFRHLHTWNPGTDPKYSWPQSRLISVNTTVSCSGAMPGPTWEDGFWARFMHAWACTNKEVGCCMWCSTIMFRPKQTWLHTADVEVGSRWDGRWKGIILKCCIVHGCVLQRYRDTAVDISKWFLLLCVCVCSLQTKFSTPTALDWKHTQAYLGTKPSD